MIGTVCYAQAGVVARITLNNPPVNALGLAVRGGLMAALARARDDDAIRAIVLAGAGRGFSAGGDIGEFGTPAATATPGLSMHVHALIESLGKPVVAALHGFAMGGGLETALACHLRVAEINTKIALPEAKVGTLPLSGTQRLPRVIGLAAAIDLILSGRTCVAGEFAGTRMFDALVPVDTALPAAERLARDVAAAFGKRPRALPLIRHLPLHEPDAPAILAAARSGLDARQGALVQRGMLAALAACVEAKDFDEGMCRARAIFDELMSSDEMRVHRARFFSEPAARQQ